MTQADFIEMELQKARAAALSKWEKMMEKKPATYEGVEFSKWMKREVDRYARDASETLKERFRYCSMYDSHGIHNVVYAFLLHLIRRNCEVGSQVKSLSSKDVDKAKAIVREVLDLAAEEKWRKTPA